MPRKASTAVKPRRTRVISEKERARLSAAGKATVKLAKEMQKDNSSLSWRSAFSMAARKLKADRAK